MVFFFQTYKNGWLQINETCLHSDRNSAQSSSRFVDVNCFEKAENRLASFTTILWKSVFSNNAYLFKLRFVKIWSSAIWVEILERLAQCRRFQRVFQIQFFVNIELLVFVIPVITRQLFKKCHKINVPLSVGNNTRCWSWWIVCRLMVIDFRRVLDHFRILQCIWMFTVKLNFDEKFYHRAKYQRSWSLGFVATISPWTGHRATEGWSAHQRHQDLAFAKRAHWSGAKLYSNDTCFWTRVACRAKVHEDSIQHESTT